MRGCMKKYLILPLWAYLLSPVFVYGYNGGWGRILELQYFFHIFLSLLWAGFFVFLFGNRFRLQLVLLPFFLIAAADLFVVTNFDSRLSTSYLMLAVTDASEISEFLRSYAQPLAISALLFFTIYFGGLWGMRRTVVRAKPIPALACLLVLFASYAALFVKHLQGNSDFRTSALGVLGKELSAPVGPIFQMALTSLIVSENAELLNQRNSHVFNAKQATEHKQNELYVLVIGESARPQNWSLFGYTRNTTPKIKSTNNIIPLPNVITTDPLTSFAVPSLLSLENIHNFRGVLSHRSIVSAFREAGFETHWLSTQEADVWGGMIPHLASEAQHKRYFERTFDARLLPELSQIIDDAAKEKKKTLVVLHTKGSHFEFSRRYPDSFKNFESENNSRRNMLVDTYDNSILYTDWFLSRVIEIIRNARIPSLMLYSSDHGENLLDTSAGLFGHNIGNIYDLKTAAFAWISPEFNDNFPKITAALTKNANKPISIGYFSHSLLHAAGIRTNNLNTTLSIFSDEFSPQPRQILLRGNALFESDLDFCFSCSSITK